MEGEDKMWIPRFCPFPLTPTEPAASPGSSLPSAVQNPRPPRLATATCPPFDPGSTTVPAARVGDPAARPCSPAPGSLVLDRSGTGLMRTDQGPRVARLRAGGCVCLLPLASLPQTARPACVDGLHGAQGRHVGRRGSAVWPSFQAPWTPASESTDWDGCCAQAPVLQGPRGSRHWPHRFGLPERRAVFSTAPVLCPVAATGGSRPGRWGPWRQPRPAVWRAMLAVQVGDRGFLELESGNVLQVLPQPRGVPERSSG